MDSSVKNGDVIGVDLGGTKMIAARFSSAGEERARLRYEVAGLSQEALVALMSESILTLKNDSTLLEYPRVVGAGFGVPTTIDQRTGTAVLAANLPLADLPLRDILTAQTGIVIALDNDANVAALAEQRLGAGHGKTDDLIMITLGTGLGGGIISGGVIQRGAIGAAAEFGHVSINIDGIPCLAQNCPGIGCAEAYVSGNALARYAREEIEANPDGVLAQAVANGSPARGETVTELARSGDQACAKIIAEMARMLGFTLVNFVNMFNPGVIAIGGGLSPILDLLLPTAQEIVEKHALPPGNRFVEIVPAKFGADAGVIGAALMVRDAMIQDSQ